MVVSYQLRWTLMLPLVMLIKPCVYIPFVSGPCESIFKSICSELIFTQYHPHILKFTGQNSKVNGLPSRLNAWSTTPPRASQPSCRLSSLTADNGWQLAACSRAFEFDALFYTIALYNNTNTRTHHLDGILPCLWWVGGTASSTPSPIPCS